MDMWTLVTSLEAEGSTIAIEFVKLAVWYILVV